MKTKNLRQSVTIKAKPVDVYDALMNSKKHSKFTDGPAKISTNVGGKFTVYGDYIKGENLELKKNKKIVQSWHAKGWVEDYYSKVTFNILPFKGNTKILFIHTGIPEEDYESIKKGWIDYYWIPMKKMLEK